MKIYLSPIDTCKENYYLNDGPAEGGDKSSSSPRYEDMKIQLGELWKSAEASKPWQKTFVCLMRDSEQPFVLCFLPIFQDFIDFSHLLFQAEES